MSLTIGMTFLPELDTSSDTGFDRVGDVDHPGGATVVQVLYCKRQCVLLIDKGNALSTPSSSSSCFDRLRL